MKLFSPLLLALSLVASLTACSNQPAETMVPIEIGQDTSCALDGMLLADYPGPKAQMHFEGGQTGFLRHRGDVLHLPQTGAGETGQGVVCSGHGQGRLGGAKGHWIDAFKAFYVQGSSVHGSMGPTIASFASEADARAFSEKNGGKVMGFKGLQCGHGRPGWRRPSRPADVRA